jgi:hypothetical protein
MPWPCQFYVEDIVQTPENVQNRLGMVTVSRLPLSLSPSRHSPLSGIENGSSDTLPSAWLRKQNKKLLLNWVKKRSGK